MNSIANKDKLILWSLNKRYLPRFSRNYVHTENDTTIEDGAEKNELILNLDGESDEEYEQSDR